MFVKAVRRVEKDSIIQVRTKVELLQRSMLKVYKEDGSVDNVYHEDSGYVCKICRTMTVHSSAVVGAD